MGKKEKSILGSFLGRIPIVGDFFKELGKTDVFKGRFKEVDEQIKENLIKNQKKGWDVKARVSMRPLIDKVKKETSEISIREDFFYGKKGNKLTLAVVVPTEKVSLLIKGKNLFITADKFKKKIELPGHYSRIKKQQYEKGILVLKLTT